MSYSVETKIQNGRVTFENLPFDDGTPMTVVFVPKMDLEKMSIEKIRTLTSGIKGNLSEDVDQEREER